ncbi:MAG: trypsin-like peptidase domain-containing protein [Bacteriovoracaceae bacterium]|nr:trypsin-like peptidase domain-containing protein [Bacteriovoracaceae bacterium]
MRPQSQGRGSLGLLGGLVWLSCFIFPGPLSFGQDEAAMIYDRDDRWPLFLATSFQQQLATGVAALIKKERLLAVPQTDFYHLQGRTLAELGYDPLMRYAHEISVAECTGFLVDQDILVTAGHCLFDEACNKDYVWVFNFKQYGRRHYFINQEDVYTCQKVLKQEKNTAKGIDWAVLALDRPAVMQQPFLYRQSGQIQTNQEVISFGFPSGVSLKITLDGRVIDNTPEGYFTATLDAFVGNSGSPVVDPATGIVEGLLVRGGLDYHTDEKTGLKSPIRVGNRYRMAEEVVRITQIPLAKIIAQYERD